MKRKDQKNKFTLNEILPRLAGAKFFIAGAVALSLFAASCKKESPIGLDVQPEGDLLHTRVTDTVSITTYTVKDDSVKTDDLPSGTTLLGSYNDSVFGVAEASVYSQFRLPTNAPNFTGATLDSIVLSLAYEGPSPFYGSITDQQTLKVYQVIETISKDASYYSNQDLDVYPSDLTASGNGYTFTPNVTDSVLVGAKKEKPQVRIPLNINFGYLILTAGQNTNLATNTSFLEFLKGLYIAPANGAQQKGQGSILTFNLLDGKSGVNLYYHIGTEALSYRLQVDASAARFSRFKHNYTGTPVETELSNPSLGQDVSYIQGMAGVKTKIMFPQVKHLTDSGKIAVNHAELIIKGDPSTIHNLYPAPDKLFLLPATSTGSNGNLIGWADFQEGASYYGGTYDITTNEYHFNVSRYVQSIIDGTAADYGLYLIIAGNAVNADRLVIGGGSNPVNGMKLRLTYTKLD
jgi:hypothetical protein